MLSWFLLLLVISNFRFVFYLNQEENFPSLTFLVIFCVSSEFYELGSGYSKCCSWDLAYILLNADAFLSFVILCLSLVTNCCSFSLLAVSNFVVEEVMKLLTFNFHISFWYLFELCSVSSTILRCNG